MAIEIDKGTRLLCVRGTSPNHPLDQVHVGTVYTCRQFFRDEELIAEGRCTCGPNCHGAVLLEEFGDVYVCVAFLQFVAVAYCPSHFVPLGGDLPAEIVAAADNAKRLVATPARERVKVLARPVKEKETA